jgi:pimeloyl-ACP methyl ester carboxylesterase
MRAYSEQIVFAPSEDQRWMAGVLMRPTTGPARSVGVVCIHGTARFFYEPALIYVGRELAQRGYLVVSGNTRGHDVGAQDAPWPLSVRPDYLTTWRLGGDSWRRWDEEPYDVAGWITFLVSHGVEQVVLFGHSQGVLRVTYYQAQRQDPRVVGMVLSSAGDRLGPQDPARVEMAEQWVAEGRGDELLPVDEGYIRRLRLLATESATHVVHWERVGGPFAAEGHTPWIADIRVPVLATLGTMELNPNLRASVEEMRARAVQAPRFDMQVIEGADHFYTGCEHELAEVVAGWLEARP